jgi:hypothetical protein
MKTAISFEKLLIEKGYKPFVYDKSKGFVEPKGTYPSSMSIVALVWSKETPIDGNQTITTGLNEINTPPTLIYPRPLIKTEREVYKISRDFEMSRVFANFTDLEILNAIESQSALVVSEQLKNEILAQ